MKKIYCGGVFHFDYQDPQYRDQVAEDYRAVLLGSADRLLQRCNGLLIHDDVMYIGPFYFESDGMQDRDIVQSEINMIKRCTDAVFLLDEAGCPGTICELTMASMLGKNVHLFYLRRSDHQETESDLHTPCWYPIIHSCLINENSFLHECRNPQEAVDKIRALVQSW